MNKKINKLEKMNKEEVEQIIDQTVEEQNKIVKPKKGRKKGMTAIINKFKLEQYDFKKGKWIYIKDYSSIVEVAKDLKITHAIIYNAYKGRHKILSKFIKISDIRKDLKNEK
jgi:hypothetical protein